MAAVAEPAAQHWCGGLACLTFIGAAGALIAVIGSEQQMVVL